MSSSSEEDDNQLYCTIGDCDYLEWERVIEPYIESKCPEGSLSGANAEARAQASKRGQIFKYLNGHRALEVQPWRQNPDAELIPVRVNAADPSGFDLISWNNATFSQIIHGIVLKYSAENEPEDAMDDFWDYEPSKSERKKVRTLNDRVKELIRRCGSDLSSDDIKTRRKYLSLFEDSEDGVSIANQLALSIKKPLGNTLSKLMQIAIDTEAAKPRGKKASPKKKEKVEKKKPPRTAATYAEEAAPYVAAAAGTSPPEVASDPQMIDLLNKVIKRLESVDTKVEAADTRFSAFEKRLAEQEAISASPANSPYGKPSKGKGGFGKGGGYGKGGYGKGGYRQSAPWSAECWNCGKPGHFARDCKSVAPKPATIAAARDFSMCLAYQEEYEYADEAWDQYGDPTDYLAAVWQSGEDKYSELNKEHTDTVASLKSMKNELEQARSSLKASKAAGRRKGGSGKGDKKGNKAGGGDDEAAASNDGDDY